MPWRDVCPMDQRSKFLEHVLFEPRPSFSAACRMFGISRQTGYKWLRRYKQDGSLEEKSRRPHTHPLTTTRAVVKRILAMRKQFPRWGPVPIRHRLRELRPDIDWPAVSTIGAILKRNGVVKPRRKRARVAPRTRPFSKCREPNDVWCVDFKGQFKLGDGSTCYPLTVMDAASRYLLACVAFHHPTLDNVRAVFVELFRKYGLPAAIRSDNGEPFASTSAAAGLTQLSAWWARLGIRLERIDPGKPQQNGRHERMHLTLKQETCSPPRRSLGWQQRAFDRFRKHYNEVRPHQGIELRTPASLYKLSTRPYPESIPALAYPMGDVHCVRPDGTIQFQKRRQFVSTSLAGELVGLYSLDERYVEVIYADIVLGLIDTKNNNVNPRYGLLRARPEHGNRRPTKLSAMYPV
jgi:transposase InsO family protein